MSYKMDYSTPFTIKQSGRDAFNDGVERGDCPISSRTCANGIHWWLDGWDEERNDRLLTEIKKEEDEIISRNSRRCKGRDCGAIDGIGHSDECIAEHESHYAQI
jgi:hypothetical protein